MSETYCTPHGRREPCRYCIPDPLDALAASDPDLGVQEQEAAVLDLAQTLGGHPDADATQLFRALVSTSLVTARRLGRIENLLDARIPGDL